ncbi:dihydroorotate oxidase A [Kaistia soli DSM 19436]|uniref:Dihydroorotate dehydrogenase (quinone) n=1 Tax=Kaistia soli DSM 19436 TaxID=1122133 RepID=A0A1M4YQU3_9HYPH|nr:quinone-dependent dihydroorotate dehydrogenase [Kaistia soli]SHF08219.1 dihydroorotate oxidase A [Kaistia soli DSM 19436]
MSLYDLLRPAIFRVDPETAHGLSLKVIGAGLTGARSLADDPRLARQLLGLDFRNPLGIAAGLDKNAEVADGLLALGFGFVEVGTVTPKPQDGNPRPRMFRLVEDGAVINRLGFNNKGHQAARQNLLARKQRGGIVGVNIGANKDAADRIADYVAGITAFADLASYFTVNVSSPNTPGLRDLQGRAALDGLLARVVEARDAAPRRVPVLVKIAPDMDEAGLADVAEVVLARRLDGVIISNTTISRPALHDRIQAKETGGLSGKPLFHLSTVMLARFRALVGPSLPLIGVGGVDSAETAFAKIAAGADLVQLYTGIVYGGPTLPAEIIRGLARILDRRGLASIADAVGIERERWAAGG